MTDQPKAKYKAQMEYQKRSVAQVKFALNKKTDADILEWLKRQDKIATYLKRLIREDMIHSGVQGVSDNRE